MRDRYYEVTVARVVDRKHNAIQSTITSPVIAEDKEVAWIEFCNRRDWPLGSAPSPQRWIRTITEVGMVRWEYLLACFEEVEQ